MPDFGSASARAQEIARQAREAAAAAAAGNPAAAEAATRQREFEFAQMSVGEALEKYRSAVEKGTPDEVLAAEAEVESLSTELWKFSAMVEFGDVRKKIEEIRENIRLEHLAKMNPAGPNSGPKSPDRDPTLTPRFDKIRSLLAQARADLADDSKIDQVAAILNDCLTEREALSNAWVIPAHPADGDAFDALNKELIQLGADYRVKKITLEAAKASGGTGRETPEQKKERELHEFLDRAKRILEFVKSNLATGGPYQLDNPNINHARALFTELKNHSGPQINALEQDILNLMTEAEVGFVASETKALNSFLSQAESAFTIPEIDQYPNHKSKVEQLLIGLKSPVIGSSQALTERKQTIDRIENRLKELDEQYEAAKAAGSAAAPAPKTPDQIEQEFREAETEYKKAKEEHEKAQGVMSHFGKRKEVKGMAAEQAQKAKERYERARAEYMLQHGDKFVDEGIKAAEARFAEYAQSMGLKNPENKLNVMGWMKRGYAALGELSVYNLLRARDNSRQFSPKEEFIYKTLNVRTAIALGSLAYGGVAWYTGGKAISAGVATAMALKRMTYGSASGAVGFSDLYKLGSSWGRGKTLEKEMQDISNPRKVLMPEQLADIIARYETRSFMRGQNPAEDPAYKELLQVQYQNIEGAGAARLDFLQQNIKATEAQIAKRVGQSKRRSKYAALLGAVVGGGWLSSGDYQVLKGLFTAHTGAENLPPPPISGTRADVNLPNEKVASEFKLTLPKDSMFVQEGPSAPKFKIDFLHPDQTGIKLPKVSFGAPEMADSTPAPAAPPAAPVGEARISLPKDSMFVQQGPSAPKFKIDFLHPDQTGIKLPKVSFDHPAPASSEAAVEAAKSATAGGAKTIEAAGSGANAAEQQVNIRSGATMDIKGDEAILHAGKRGIEGAMIDLKAANPEVYGKMIVKLHEQFPDYKGNDKGLIDHFVRQFAAAKGFDLDSGSSHDLSRILAADVHIGADGTPEISLEKLKFMQEIQHAQTLTEAPPDLADKLPSRPVDIPPMQPAEVEAPIEHAGISSTDAPIDPGHDARLNYIETHPKLNSQETLKLVFDNNATKYKSFLTETLGIKERQLGPLNRMNWGEFKARYAGDYRFAKTFGKLATELNKLVNLTEAEFEPKTSMKKLLVVLAERSRS
ncbi:MAG: hypothetical protein A3J07_03130 [Candidatus Doudnabacteria bacterium RIFCSPLOWO2_02_FULL_49_13]|uniref:Uncharacterized protein n=1 Tax=Candidatus Doudnabacteria bacterium RIFCSPHIGHO2_12_FULL_48_16 TaxID=1817838 RepID=A0A1F5PLL5_9BACT|nr:MAG: hypothetical protein A3B77_01935 [Candidatus Doudnabacteria bacterium RIFCSPHIGHO2_02_FULL_49_24]OGE90828.1 MAG: hypothetical protein A3E29_01500 [Candidatus Doudnabacteria bacterium RIFCSPHIGHO2_12_FULL_48_16]OGE97539.1 MAG: hypothetical protein A2990_02360 [Candidatus Doudnabacteria bacterium RIFCSPLOWO2_01_FULL_49_40]OGF03057.1 MAG: hypothetical protein A3J07_03130 [Candidatus Doudnabacteria bacterium RIFCSPLOWO2_02_FULL_49_13]OGF03900.1 MAG: hypothetical protein A3H14_03110 [Candida